MEKSSCSSAWRNYWAANQTTHRCKGGFPHSQTTSSGIWKFYFNHFNHVNQHLQSSKLWPSLPFPFMHLLFKESRSLQPQLFANTKLVGFSDLHCFIFSAKRKVRKHLQPQSYFVSYLSVTELSADMNSSPFKTGISLTYIVGAENLWYNLHLPLLCVAHGAIISSNTICSLRKHASGAVK